MSPGRSPTAGAAAFGGVAVSRHRQAGEHGRKKGAKRKLKPDEPSQPLERGGWSKHKPVTALSENSQIERACGVSPNRKSPPPPGCPAGIV